MYISSVIIRNGIAMLTINLFDCFLLALNRKEIPVV